MNTRREFLKKTAAVSTGVLMMPSLIQCGNKKSPNDLINMKC